MKTCNKMKIENILIIHHHLLTLIEKHLLFFSLLNYLGYDCGLGRAEQYGCMKVIICTGHISSIIYFIWRERYCYNKSFSPYLDVIINTSCETLNYIMKISEHFQRVYILVFNYTSFTYAYLLLMP